MTALRKRTRLSPDARKDQLLDTATQMIVAAGLQSFSMESLARTAGVSSPLVYNYFASRPVLLKTLLEREFEAYAQELTGQVNAAQSFEEVVRIFVGSNFDHHAPGNILPILESQPEIAVAIRDRQEGYRKQVGAYLVASAAETYKLSRTQAELVVSMSSGASVAAAGYAARNNADREKTIDLAMTYIQAGLNRIAQRNEP